jgi:tripartite-type tricarboxylate transporter receptor subunit TctC
LYALSYGPIRDLAPISELFSGANILALANGVPAKSVKELVALAKARPGELTFASGGSGSTAHMAGELFKSTAGIDIRHVPYKGVLAAAPDLLSGRVSMVFSPMAIVLPMVREGKLHAIAVTGARRSSAAPDLPTIAESGYPGFDVAGWDGLFAPARTPAAILRTLHLAAVNALTAPDVRARLADFGLEGVGSSPEEFAVLIQSQMPKWAKVVSERGIKVD